MTTSTVQRLAQVLPTLSQSEQEHVLDYIEFMRGKSIFDDLSDEDNAELQRRAATIDASTAIPLDRVIAGARARLKREH